ncbi:carbonic anhydrase 6-like [Tachypleus tridentatus]|uniref:carbonic anhydrase 6-like n=1 Tax=Tachypleus tridentatus TaxID=6853 RepID=UPI003FD070EB
MGIGIVVLLSFLLGVVTGEGDFHWNYHGGAAFNKWAAVSKFCSSNKQSPINIEKSRAKKNSQLGKISFIGYDSPLQSAMIKNNGHTAQVTITETKIQRLKLADWGTGINSYNFTFTGANPIAGAQSTRLMEKSILWRCIWCTITTSTVLPTPTSTTMDSLFSAFCL